MGHVLETEKLERIIRQRLFIAQYGKRSQIAAIEVAPSDKTALEWDLLASKITPNSEKELDVDEESLLDAHRNREALLTIAAIAANIQPYQK